VSEEIDYCGNNEIGTIEVIFVFVFVSLLIGPTLALVYTEYRVKKER
jgi:hypothetical protein